MHVGLRKAGGIEPRRHRFRRARGIAGRGGGIDFDELLVDIMRELLRRRQLFGTHAAGNEENRKQDCRKLPSGFSSQLCPRSHRCLRFQRRASRTSLAVTTSW